MKKGLGTLLVACAFLFTGCSMPFTGPNKDDVAAFADSSDLTISASSQIDSNLMTELSKAKAGNTSFILLTNEIYEARKAQQNLYQDIKNEQVPSGEENMQATFLTIINNRIADYDILLHSISQQDYNLIDQDVKNHQASDKQSLQKGLADVNTELKKIGAPSKQSL